MTGKNQKALIQNNAQGPRGVNTVQGVTILEPGESRELELSEAEFNALPEDFEVVDEAALKKQAEAREKAAKAAEGKTREEMFSAIQAEYNALSEDQKKDGFEKWFSAQVPKVEKK